MLDIIRKHKIFISLFFILILYILFNNGVFAVSQYSFYEDFFTSSDVSKAQQLAGSVWNDESYDIFLVSNFWWGAGLTGSAGNNTKCLMYFKVNDLPSGIVYKLRSDTNTTVTTGGYTFNSNLIRFVNTKNESFSISDVNYKSIDRYEYASNSYNYISISNSDWAGNYSLTPYGTLNYGFVYDLFSNKKRYYVRPIRTHYDICDVDGDVIYPATNPVGHSFFDLEYNEEQGSYFVYSNWYNYVDNSRDDLYSNTWYAHQHFYQVNPEHGCYFFDSDMRESQGWLNMEGSENELGPRI